MASNAGGKGVGWNFYCKTAQYGELETHFTTHVQGQPFCNNTNHYNIRVKGRVQGWQSGLAASYSNDTMKETECCGYAGMHMMTTSYATYIKFNTIHTYIMKHLK